MTVLDVTRRAGNYAYSGDTYQFYFKVFLETDITVYVTNDVSGESGDNILTLNTDYTVTLNEDQDNDPGGTVTLLSTYDSSYYVAIGSSVPETQEVVLTNKGGFYPETLNDEYDKLTILIQQLQEELDRCLKVAFQSEETPEELIARLLTAQKEAEAYAQQAADYLATIDEYYEYLSGIYEDLYYTIEMLLAAGSVFYEEYDTSSDVALTIYAGTIKYSVIAEVS